MHGVIILLYNGEVVQMKVLFLVPSKLDGPSARYVIALSCELLKLNLEVFISSENEDSEIKDRCLKNIKMPDIGNIASFDNYVKKIKKLNINVVFSIGSRVKIDLIGLYLKKLGVLYVKQFEDDEETIFLNCNKNSRIEEYQSLLKQGFNAKFDEIDLSLLHKTKFKVIDPYIKGITLSLLNGYTKIWGGLSFDEEIFLRKVKYLSLPPVCANEEIEALKNKVNLDITEDTLYTYFIGGSIYSKQDIDIFISAWSEFKKIVTKAKLIISHSRTSKILIDYLIENYQNKDGINIIDLPSDNDYLEVLSASMFVLSIGGGQFDEKRLPSRLVKSMFLGKNIITPSAGFGKALTNKLNGFVCATNTKEEWLSTLLAADQERNSTLITNNAATFAKNNFDINNIANEFRKFINEIQDKVSSFNFDKIPIEYCMMADAINLNNMPDKGKSRPAIKRIKFRLIHVGESLFVQTLERADYNFQVECSAKALVHDSAIIGIKDTGFNFLRRFGDYEFFGIDCNPSISGKEITELLVAFRGKLPHLSPNGRSSIFDKVVLGFRLFKLITHLMEKLGIKFVFFHADMQPIEALVSFLINNFNPNTNTITLQHALFYEIRDEVDVNAVNARVSPSNYSFFWDNDVAKLVNKYNPEKKKAFVTRPPSLLLEKLNSQLRERSLLVILDGPNHDSYNEALLVLCDRLVECKMIAEYYIKPHPYHTPKQRDILFSNGNRQLVEVVDCLYKNVLFVSSTLGTELHGVGFPVYQFFPKEFRDLKLTFEHLDIERFSSFEILAKFIKLSRPFNERLNNYCFHHDVLKYQESFQKAVKEIA
jgi:hypothetical protein